MKLISKSSSKSNDSSGSKKKSKKKKSDPQKLIHTEEVPAEAVQSHVQEPAQKTARPAPQEKFEYPEASLSDKQLEALQSVIKPSAWQIPGQISIEQENENNPSGGKRKKKSAQSSMEIESGERSIVKTVILVIFMIAIISAAGFAGWYYWWTTYATFDYEVHPVVVLDGQSIEAVDFLYPEEIMEGISAAMRNPGFEPAKGFQFVPLTLTLGLRTVDTAATLYVLSPIEYTQHEFGVVGTTLRPVDFLTNADVASGITFEIRFTEELLPLEEYPVGEFPVHLALNDEPFIVMLHIVDTTPPTATSVNKTIQIGTEISAEEFVTDVFDLSPIASISFVEEPDILSRDDQTVKVAVEDIHGNVAVVQAELSILFNKVPPELEGMETIESEIGTAIDYLQGVTAHDDFGREIGVHVDDTGVDQNTEGTYTAIYWAEDYTGLRTEVEVTVHILSVDPEEIYQQVDEILARILNDGMTQVDQVRVIQNWIMQNLGQSTTDFDSQSVLEGAARALQDRRGDSKVFSALAEVMLTRAGIPNMRISRTSEADKEHTWNLINPDERGWHHFDSYRTGLVLGSLASMFTDSQAKDIARRIEAHNRTKDYYTYDPELYPEVVQE